MSTLTTSARTVESLIIPTLATVGAITLTYTTIRALRGIYNFVRPSSLPRYLHSKTGSWALVTGASDGIGRAFAEELLARGFNVVLHGRNQAKLQRVVNELAATYDKRRLNILVADASDATQDFSAIRKKMDNLPGQLTVLVNNVGGIHSPKQFDTLAGNSSKELVDTINVNATFTTCLTSALLPLLVSNGPSLILNCGSIAPVICPPYISTYVGTKGYILSWSTSLRHEMKAEKLQDLVEVLTVAIGNTSSGSNTYEDATTLSPTACARSCLDRVGCGLDVIIPHPKYVASMLPLELTPQFLINNITASMMKKRHDAEQQADLKSHSD